MEGQLYEDWSGEAWQHYSISSLRDGRALCLVRTNDDDDDGLDDGQVVEWQETFATVAAALRYSGQSRVGVSGIRVLVTVDGSQV